MENQHQELEEMRQQFQLLNTKLDNQTIVSDQLIRQSMLSKMSFLRRYTWITYLILPIVLLDFIYLRSLFDFSWAFIIGTMVILSLCVFANSYINRYRNQDFSSGNLLDVSRQMVRQRTLRKRFFIVGNLLLVLWFAWLFYEVHDGMQRGVPAYRELSATLLIGSFSVGFIIGTFIGIRNYLKMQRINSEIIRQIDDLIHENV